MEKFEIMVEVVKTYFFKYFNIFSLSFMAKCLRFSGGLRFRACFCCFWLKVVVK